MENNNDSGRAETYAPRQRAADARRTVPGKTSSRRLSVGRRAWYWLIVTLARAVLRVLWATCRLEAVIGQQHQSLGVVIQAAGRVHIG